MHDQNQNDLRDSPKPDSFSSMQDSQRRRRSLTYKSNLLGNIEQALKGLLSYGIMALELIQNADDASSKRLYFDARDEALIVGNDEEFTSCGLEEEECPWILSGDITGLKRPCNFHAISDLASRSKLHAAEQIGRFGIGFVSVYQITDTPIIRSSGVELRLNPLTRDSDLTDVGPTLGTEFILPWASSKSEIRDGLNASPTPLDVADKVVAEIEQILQGSLLFLRHIERVELSRNGNLVVSVDIDRSDDEVSLTFSTSELVQRWLILSREADDVVESTKLFERFDALTRLERKRTVNIAIPINVEHVDGLLYAYLPTQQPTRMPIHVNADFFPHATRKAIVLEGEQHERYWNEALIETAAASLSENVVRIRDTLGPERFWSLAASAFQRKAEPAFKFFWDRLGPVLKETPSVWTTSKEWRLPTESFLPPESLGSDHKSTISDLGLPIIVSELRPHWVVLASVGAQQLRLSNIVTALESSKNLAADHGSEYLRRVWSATGAMIEAAPDRSVLHSALTRLKTIPFIIDVNDVVISPLEARRLPDSVSLDLLMKVVPTRRVVHRDVLQILQVAELVPEYRINELASDLAELVTDEASALSVIGATDPDVTSFYSLLTSFPIGEADGKTANILANVPMLRTGTGFVSPSRGQLPGDFRDPIGHFEIIESKLFVAGMREMAESVLNVGVLTFRDYVSKHLEDIIKAGVTHKQYGALITEIVNHRAELDEDGTLGALAKIAFVRTRAGTYAQPKHVYVWSAALENILGIEPDRWVDHSWIPEALQARARDLFERLEMPFTVAPQHIVDRVKAIAESNLGLDVIVDGTTPIIQHVLDRWTRFADRDRTVLGQLKDVSFLTAMLDGKRDEKHRYLPSQVYRARRALGFSSQVPIVELSILRQANTKVSEFLDLINMPPEPPTQNIVAHLEHCMNTSSAVNDFTYQMLSERLERKDDIDCIDRLEGNDFIYVSDVGFIGAGEVFWIPPMFGDHWHSASPKMRQREQLYRRLGVVDSPEPNHYAALAIKIAISPDPSDRDVTIHGRCLAALAEALEREDEGASDAVDTLVNQDALFNVDGEALWVGDAIWLDSEQLAAAFGSVLNDRLIRIPDVSRSALSRFLKRLEVPALTDIAQFRLAKEPEGRPATEATSLLNSRSDLLLWLAPNRASREALRKLLVGIEIRLSEQLLVQAEIDAFDPPVRSPAASAPAYLDQETRLLHLRHKSGRVDWAAASRVLFSEIERYCPTADVPPLCMTAAYIMSLQNWADAEQALLASDFKAPDDFDFGFEFGRELADDPDEETIFQEPSQADASGLEDSAGDFEDLSHDDEFSEAQMDDANAESPEVDTTNSERTNRFISDGNGSARASGTRGAGELPGESHLVQGDIDGVDSGDEEPNTFGKELDAPYGSARSRETFGKDPEEKDALSGGAEGDKRESGGASDGKSRAADAGVGGNDVGRKDYAQDRQARNTRMLTYVSRSGSREKDDAGAASGSENLSDLIDAAAMKAALSYEEGRGWKPERQPHFNPGFDIVSTSPSGDRRLIEVKGLDNEWTERGIKLSHVQFAMAREHPDEFWIYTVEHARNLDRQRVTAIENPFAKVEEYWFDDNWREASSEQATSFQIHAKVGTKVKHHHWGRGDIVEVNSRGAILYVVVDFGRYEGKRNIPFNASLQILD